MNPKEMNIKAAGVNIYTKILGVNLVAQGKVILAYYGPGTDDPEGVKLAEAQKSAGPDDLVVAAHYVDAVPKKT
jgi:hypothetical protein